MNIFDNLKRFKAKEFPSQKEIDMTDPRLFRTLDEYAIDLGYLVYPSKAKGALARDYGDSGSRHYAVGRLSTAVDFFPDCSILRAFFMACHYFGGVGLYFDTHFRKRRWIMLHGDLRNHQRIWWREDEVYHTVNTNADYWKLIDLIKKRACK